MQPPDRELTEAVALCTRDGRLAPEAPGWSRRPLHDCAIPGRWGRRKRWHHWCITTGRFAVTVTLADLDYLGIAALVAIDLERGTTVRRFAARPLGLGAVLPDGPTGRVALRLPGLAFDLEDRIAGATLHAAGRGLSLDATITRPPGEDTLNVVVPWDERTFQFTSKQTALPARGALRIGGRTVELGDDALATLDFGRGVWPYRTAWNWGAASGVQDGRRIGFNLGARWTAGTGTHENAVTVDGRLRRLDDSVRFRYDRRDPLRPWQVASSSGEVELELTPSVGQRLRLPLGVIGAELDLCFGRYRGRIGDLVVRDLVGWAEELHARW